MQNQGTKVVGKRAGMTKLWNNRAGMVILVCGLILVIVGLLLIAYDIIVVPNGYYSPMILGSFFWGLAWATSSAAALSES